MSIDSFSKLLKNKKYPKVKLIIGGKTDLGFKAIVNDLHWGLLYDNEIFQPLRIGKKIDGYIKQVRDDGRLDLILTRGSKNKVNDFEKYKVFYNNVRGVKSSSQ